MYRCVLLSLAFALPAIAQNPPGYDTAFRAAKERGLPLVIFVACEGRTLDDAQCMECSRYHDFRQPGVIVGDVETLACRRLAPDATDAEIRAAYPLRARAGVREYTIGGKVYREYYSAPQQQRSTPTAAYSPAYSLPTMNAYSSFSAGPIGFYGGVGAGCVGGNCPSR